MAATIIRFGNEQRVNIETNQGQTHQSVTGLADGGWLITWVSYEQVGSLGDIYQQRYDKDGNAAWTREQQVNFETTSTQYEPSVTALADGGWVVTWSSYGQDSHWYGVYQRYYDENGVAKAEQKVNTEPFADQYESSVMALTTGGWVVTWTSVEQDGSYEGIYQQCYDKDGNPVRGEQRVNTHRANSQYEPSVTALPDGEWLVTWTSLNQDGSGHGVYQQRYNANGTPKEEGEQLVNTETVDMQIQPSVTALADGGWLVTWNSVNQDGGGEGIYQQRYNANGTPREGEQKINTYTVNNQSQPHVTALVDGGWLVTWNSLNQDGSGYGVYQQRYDEDGNPVGGEQQVNVYEAESQFQPSVTGLSDGGWLVAWTSVGQDGSVTGVYQRRYMSVAEFGEEQEYGTGTQESDFFRARANGLGVRDSLDGGDGIDTLALIAPGILDLTAPYLLISIEIVRGSDGNDIIVADAERLANITELQGGSGTDALHLRAGSYDLTGDRISGFESITLLGAGSLTFDSKAAALLARSQTQNGAITLTDGTFSAAERQQLYNQGISKTKDAGGVHILQQAQASLSTQAVTENAGASTTIGILSITDPNPGDGLRFELIDNAGGRFALSGNQLVVGNGSPLDYETGAAHRIVVRIVDEGGITTDAAFTIMLDDVPVEILKGTSGADVLKGGTGKDVLYGGLGKDTLTGDKGQDVFVFDTRPNTKSNLDKITDFDVKDDAIWLDNKGFTKFGKAGSVAKPATLKKAYFATDKAKDKDDYLIYNKKTGALSYDTDGSGSKYKAIEIALLKKGLGLKANDFFVV